MTLRAIIRVKGDEVYSIQPGVTLAHVIDTLVKSNCGSLVVMDGEKMVGIITERDILKACAARRNALEDQLVDDHMSVKVITGSPGDRVDAAMGVMTSHRIRHLPILDNGKLCGLVSIGDLVKEQHDRLKIENEHLHNYIQTDGAGTSTWA